MTEKALKTLNNDTGMETSLARMEQIIEQAASLVILLEGRLRDAEAALNQRVTVSGREAQSLTRAVQSRARVICEDAGADYHRAGETVRKAIYRAIREEYGMKRFTICRKSSTPRRLTASAALRALPCLSGYAP